jgi:hypothetical protein
VIFEYFYTTGNFIRKLIIQEHQRRRYIIVKALQRSSSKIHLSFDLWTSPNSLTFCEVVAHFLTPESKSKSLLIGLKMIHGCHSEENIAKSILKVIKEVHCRLSTKGADTVPSAPAVLSTPVSSPIEDIPLTPTTSEALTLMRMKVEQDLALAGASSTQRLQKIISLPYLTFFECLLPDLLCADES